MIARFLVCIWLLSAVHSYRHYQKRIPNGDSVPFPCKPNHIWDGVGHFLDEGTGLRNTFGIDFQAAGHRWTQALCRKDSDGDGLTNGQELGDPDCRWTEGAQPTHLTGLSHPGICDPWDSPVCRQKATTHPKLTTQDNWMEEMCKEKEFVCSGIKEPDVHNLTLRFPPTQVPAHQTTYICFIWDLAKEGFPSGDFHLIAHQPHIDNKYVMHHMIIWGCEDEVELPDVPYECVTFASKQCQDFIGTWAVGIPGECFPPEAGVKIGARGYKKIAIQFHWNNPESHSDYMDSSGTVFHYTPKLRPHEVGMLITGSNYFYLPPHREEVTVTSRCSSGCTRNVMTGPVQVFKAWNHMHLAGRAGMVEVLRNNKHLTYLTNEPIYNYDSPNTYDYSDQPFTLLPGDEIVTICNFTTRWRNTTTFYGESTQEEMCNGFMHFYPRENLKMSICMDMFERSWCDSSTLSECESSDWFKGPTINTSRLYTDIVANCKSYTPCLEECVDTLVHYTLTEPCFRGKTFEFIENSFLIWYDIGQDLLARLASCKVELHFALLGRGFNFSLINM